MLRPWAEVLTAEEAGDVLGVTARHVRRLCREGVLQGRYVAGRWWIAEGEVLRYRRDRGWCNRYGWRGGARGG